MLRELYNFVVSFCLYPSEMLLDSKDACSGQGKATIEKHKLNSTSVFFLSDSGNSTSFEHL